MPQDLETKIEMLDIVEEENYAKFAVAPLGRGFGTTLGNSLRRVLLSTLPGASISKIRITDVLHEFSTIPGVIEDVSEIILNLKEVAVVNHSETDVILNLEIEGPKVVTAGDISEDANVEIMNPDHHICTIAEDGKIEMELEVVNGAGYSIADQHKDSEDPIGTIPIDASFSPVEKVNFTVDDYRVGQEISYDRLTLEVWTNGTVSPQEATAEGGRILIDYLELFIDLPNYSLQEEAEEEEVEEDFSKKYGINIEELDLSLRAFNCLKRAGIDTVGDLVQQKESEVKKIKNFGKKSLAEVQEKLNELNLDFAPEDE